MARDEPQPARPGRGRMLVAAVASMLALLLLGASAAAGEPTRRAAESAATAPRQPATPQSLALGEVNHDLSFRDGSESSSAIAVERDDPSRVIAATADAGRRPLAFVSGSGLAAGSVVQRRFPSDALLPGGGAAGLDPCCEPAVAADASGNLWMAAAEQGSGGRVAVNRIPAGFAGFRPSSAALPVLASSAQEKPALAVADGDRIAAVWIETASGTQNVVYSGCDLSGGAADCDDPDNWSAPVPATDTGGLHSMPDLAFAPNGDLYVVWWDAGAGNAIEIDRCPAAAFVDGICTSAAGWGADHEVAGLDVFDDDGVGGPDPLPLFCPIIAAPGGLVNPSPSIEVGAAGTPAAGRVFVAYSDLRDNAEAGSGSRCTASGSDKTFDSLVAAGATPNSFPATDSGVRISDDGAEDLNDHFLPALSVDPSSGAVEASFYSTAADPGGQRTERVYVASADLGATYTAPTTISSERSRFAGPFSDGIDYGSRQGADSAAGVFRPAWTDNRPQQSRDPDLYALSPAADTTIDLAPSGTIPDARTTVRFSSPAPRIECRVDAAEFRRCSSPKVVGPLANGPHSFDARATDRAGNVVDPTGATATWTVADLDPPETTLTKQPGARTKRKRPRFAFEADEAGASFECRYDREPWGNCRSPKREKVKVGKHRFKVRATDVGGNTDPTAAVAKFERKRKCNRRKRRSGRC